MKTKSTFFIDTSSCSSTCHDGRNQELSTSLMNYKITYAPATQVIRCLLFPNYLTPDANNLGQLRKGNCSGALKSTQWFFVISNITDVNGIWDKSKLGLISLNKVVRSTC
jgi:hypothetical protein